jgi:Glycosyl transferase family 2
MPKVSVIIPNYNHGRFLEQRIRSVLTQTFQDIEIILLDDSSTDNSRQIIESFRTQSKVRVMLNEQNSGSPSHQWNKGVSLSTAPYVWIAEADDDADARFLETLVEKLDARSSVVLAQSQSVLIDLDGRNIGSLAEWTQDLSTTRWHADFTNDGHAECAEYLALKNTIPNASAVVFRREAFLNAGGAPEHMRLCGDWLTWSRLLLHGEISFVSAALNRFRIHQGTVRQSTPAHLCLSESFEVSRFIMANVRLSGAQRCRAACAAHQNWWRTLRKYPTPGFAWLLRNAWQARCFGPLFLLRLLAEAPLAAIARSALAQPVLKWKRRLLV